MFDLTRRRLLKGTALGTGAAIAGRYSAARAQGAGPLKVPVLYALSGPLATVGEPAKKGSEIAIKLINQGGGLAGRMIEPRFIDDKGRPNDAAALAREQISEGNNILLGILLSSQLGAVLPVINESKGLLITSAGSGVAWTHESFSRNVFPALDNDLLRANGLAKLAYAKFPNVTRYASVISESQAYIDSYTNFQRFLKAEYAAAGKQAPEFLPPQITKFGTSDFRNQITQVANSKADGFYNFVVGADGVTFWQQARAYNLGDQFKAVLDQTLDISVLKALRKNMPTNLWTLASWYPGLHEDEPVSQQFYKEYMAETGDKFPSGYLHYGAIVVLALAAAVRATGGKTDTESLINALETTKFHTPKGEMYFRKEDHMLLGYDDFTKVIPSDTDPGVQIPDAFRLHTASLAPPPAPGKPYVQQ